MIGPHVKLQSLRNVSMPFQEAVAMTKPIQDPEEAAKRLMQEAYQRGSADNITCVVVRFLENQGSPSRGTSG